MFHNMDKPPHQMNEPSDEELQVLYCYKLVPDIEAISVIMPEGSNFNIRLSS